jgi:hypothetical protein
MNTDLTPSGWALSGRRRVSGNVAGLVSDLSLQPRAIPEAGCSQVAGPQINYLIALTYARGRTMWVSITDDPSQCITGTNGEFVAASMSAAANATKTLVTGTWPASQPISCEGPHGNRLTQRLVPTGSTSLTICAQRTHVIKSNYRDLVSALNALPRHGWSGGCVNTRPGADYQLIFGYPTGPPETVDVETGCQPPVTNGALQADTTGKVVPIIQRLTGGH